MAEKWLEKSSKKLHFFAKAEVAAVLARTVKGLYRFPESNLAEKSALETYITCSEAAELLEARVTPTRLCPAG